MNRARYYFLFGISLVIILVSFLVTHRNVDVTISETMAQNMINDKLPMTKEKFGIQYTFLNGTVHFINPNIVSFDTNVEVTARNKTFDAHISGQGVPIYIDNKVYVSDFKVTDIKLDSDMPQEEVSSVVSKLTSVKNKLALVSLLKITDMSTETLNRYLETHPIHSFEKSFFSRTLKDIKISDQNLIVTIDPLGFIITCLIYALIGLLIIGFIIGAILNPDLFIVAIFAGLFS